MIDGRGTDERTWNAHNALDRFPASQLAEWAERHERFWIIAPHPDDEILALGGTIARLSELGCDIHIVAVTDGEASHGTSAAWSAASLARERPRELIRGLDRLGAAAKITRLELPDGRVGAFRKQLLQELIERIDLADLVLTTCRFDGHPDHEACGDVAFLASDLTGATVFEYPVWMWHWATPDEVVVPWDRARRLPLDAATMQRKDAAIREFSSQIEPFDDHEAVLPPHVLTRFQRPFEVVFS